MIVSWFSFLLINSALLLIFYWHIDNAKIGFEYLRYEGSESSSQQVCIVVNGTVLSSFHVIVNTHVGTAGTNNNYNVLMKIPCVL